MKKIYQIKGMHCASCAYTVEKALKNTPNVIGASVNYATEKAIIETMKSFNVEEASQAVKSVGYQLIDNSIAKTEVEITRLLKQKLIVGIICSIVIMALMYLPLPLPMKLNNFFQLVLASVVQFWVGAEFYGGLISLFRYKLANMYTLVSVGTLSAYIYSFVVVFNQWLKLFKELPEIVYFDSASVVITLVLLGKFLEARTKARTYQAINQLAKLSVKNATIEKNGRLITIPLKEIKVNDTMIVRPGEKIPTDGEIIEGEAEIDQSYVTGEAIPVLKKTYDMVFGSTINVSDNMIKVKATRIGEQTLLAQIIRLVEEGQASKVPIQNLADKIASYFVPVIFVIAGISFFAWILSGPSFISALLAMVSVLVVACPCALGLATPTALVTAIGNAAKQGILIKNGAALQILPEVKTLVFDKTGTITMGKPQIDKIVKLSKSISIEQDLIDCVASLEKDSHHPIARSLVAQSKNTFPTRQVRIVNGQGMLGEVRYKNNWLNFIVGNQNFLITNKINIKEFITQKTNELHQKGQTIIFIGDVNTYQLHGYVSLIDKEKPGVKESLTLLKSKEIKTILLTGDKKETAIQIGNKVGFDKDEIIAEVLPTEKQVIIQNLKNKTKNFVGMIGDGINDAAALSSADVSFAMGNGSDIAMESGDFVIVNGDIGKIISSIALAKKTFTIIKQNFFWAFIYNIVLIPLAAMGRINPMLAAGAMAASSISVVINSLRLSK